jgi:hypothetical protein
MGTSGADYDSLEAHFDRAGYPWDNMEWLFVKGGLLYPYFLLFFDVERFWGGGVGLI